MVTATPTNPSSVSELEAKALAARYGDLADYAKAVHNMDLEPYQLAWAEALNEYDRTLIVCPPDTYKSTTVQLWIEQAIGLNPDIRILWLMNSGDQAEKRVMSIGMTLASNTVYRKAFNVKQDKDAQWTKSVLFVERSYNSPDPTLMGSGLNGPYQGLHFDIIVIDDPTNQEDVRSPTTMEIQRSKLRGVIIDRLVDTGRIVAILTRWGENDLVEDFREMEFSMIHMPLVADYPWGPTISNKRFPPEKVEKIRRDKGPVLFELTFMGNVLAASGGAVKVDHINYWDRNSLPENNLIMLMAIDPASSTRQTADPSCIGIAGLDRKMQRLYVTDLWTKRVEVPDLKREIIRRARMTSGLASIGLETIGFQMSLLQDIKRTHRLPFRELPYRSRRQTMNSPNALDKDKWNRALYIDSQFTSGFLWIPKNLPAFDGVSLESELASMGTPASKHDDRGDVLAFLCAMAKSLIGRGGRVRMRAA